MIYLLNTRPDITFAVTKLAKFMHRPGREHFCALIHLLQYLHDNTNVGLTFYWKVEDSPVYDLLTSAREKNIPCLFRMHDSSWQDCPDTGQSTGSYVIFGQEGPVDYSTYIPSPVAMSSAEAECNGGAVAGMAMSHIQILQNELDGYEANIIRNGPLMMFCNSASAITIVNLDKDIKSLLHCKC